jgi:asparagine synthase (glutamine-hydrolysing)
MCGIAGYVDFGGHDREAAAVRLKAMADAIAHRGPDGEGYYIDDHAALAHRRLAIIDLAGGAQPMAAADGRVQIVFNGEIYNFAAVRADLAARGHVFRTRSDTEVILHAYLEWGEGCVDRLSGMFAFALWDSHARRLLLARDRVGKKPLYHLRRGPIVAFASELKALRAGELCPTAVDPESLDCYLTFGYVPAPRTIYQGVEKLRAGHCLSVTPRGASQRRYWHLSFSDPRPRTAQEAAEELEPLLDDAVRARLMSEVPLGAFLSGGLDSSLVVASMSRQVNRPVLTNSIGFDDRGTDELPIARSIAAHLGTDHREYVVTPRAAQVIERIAWHFDEPIADSSAVPTWYVCEMARRSVTVALSGDGGDEGFGGYTFRYAPHVLESGIRNTLPTVLRGPLFGSLGAIWPGSAVLPKPLRLKTIFENLAVGDCEAFYRDLAWLRPDTREALYSRDFMQSLRGFTPLEAVASWYAQSDARDPLSRCQYADIHFYMTDDVLVKVDRMSMAHSLEVRSPFLDHRVLELAARLPARARMAGRRGKLPLRQLAARRLPDNVHRLPKRGFSPPASRWLRDELKLIAHDALFDGQSLLGQILDHTALSRVWREHQEGSRDHHVLLWGLMMLGLWERICYGSRAAFSPPSGRRS